MFYQIGDLLINPQTIISAQLHLTKRRSGGNRSSLVLKFASSDGGKIYSKRFNARDAEELWSALSEEASIINAGEHPPIPQILGSLTH